MSYSNSKVICIPSGIPIQYNGNETNIETVWAFDETNTAIQRFTFKTTIHPDMSLLTQAFQSALENPIVSIKSGFLFYSFQYQMSFAHYISQTLPYLTHYFQNYPTMKLLIPEHIHNSMQQDIFKLLNIKEENIVLLRKNTVYHIDTLIKPPPYPVCPPNNANADQVWIYTMIRNSLAITPNSNPHRKIYLKRDGVPNSTFGNSETGITRTILNTEEFEALLTEHNFEIHTLGNKTFQEKYELLKDAKLLISQLGANCTNLLFTNAPKHVLLLSNTEPLGENYYIHLSEHLNKSPIEYSLFQYSTIDKTKDRTNKMNGPFFVDLKQIQNWIVSRDIE